MLDDLELIKRAQDGHGEAFGGLYDKYLPRIYRFVFLKVSNKQIAEDLTQQVFLSAWQNIRNYRHKGFPFTSWLYQIARNAVIDHYRTEKIHLELAEAEEVGETAALAIELDNKLSMEEVRKGLKRLPQHYQDVILMRFIEELTPREVAAAMNKSEGAIKVLQHRALAELKKVITKEQNEEFA